MAKAIEGTKLEKALKAQTDVREMITDEESAIEGMKEELGTLLAAHRMGESGAQKKASTVSMDLGKRRSNLDLLRSEEVAISKQVDSIQQGMDAETHAQFEAEAVQLMAEAQEAEEAYAEIMRQAIVLAEELRSLSERERQLRRKAIPAPLGLRAVKNPVSLLNGSLINNGERDIERWLNHRHGVKTPRTPPKTKIGEPGEPSRFTMPTSVSALKGRVA